MIITKEMIMKDMQNAFNEKRGNAPVSGYGRDIANWHTETKKLWEYFCAGCDYIAQIANGTLPSPTVTPQITDPEEFCDSKDHIWVSAKNEHVTNGSICTKCYMIDCREPDELKKEQEEL